VIFQAEVRRKLLHGEDALTSRVIGLLPLTEPTCSRAILEELTGDGSEADQATFSFWPDYDGTEPDVVLRMPSRIVVIEAKNVADALTPEQLAREWRMVSMRTRLPVQVIALTPDASEPEAVSAAESDVLRDGALAGTMRWARWQHVARRYETLRSDASLSQTSRNLISEVLRFMEARGMRGFGGLTSEEIKGFREIWHRAPATFAKLRSSAEEVGELSGGEVTALARSSGFERGGRSNAYTAEDRWRPNFLEFYYQRRGWPDYETPDTTPQVDVFLRHDLDRGEAICGVGWRTDQNLASLRAQSDDLARETTRVGLQIGVTNYHWRTWHEDWEPQAFGPGELDLSRLKLGEWYGWRLEVVSRVDWDDLSAPVGLTTIADRLLAATRVATAAGLDPDALLKSTSSADLTPPQEPDH
jgi:hypothetical protein